MGSTSGRHLQLAIRLKGKEAVRGSDMLPSGTCPRSSASCTCELPLVPLRQTQTAWASRTSDSQLVRQRELGSVLARRTFGSGYLRAFPDR